MAGRALKLRIEVKEGIQAVPELLLNLLARAFQDVHGDVCLVTICQLERCIMDLRNLALGQEPHSVNQSQIGHVLHHNEVQAVPCTVRGAATI